MRFSSTLLLAAFIAVPSLSAAETKFNVNINLGGPTVVAPPPPAAVVAPPKMLFEEPPLFLMPTGLGFYVGVDTQHDIVLVSGVYYLFQGNQWYRASNYNGPWTVTRYEKLPEPVRRHKLEHIREHREREFHSYRDKRDHYRGKHFRPGREGKEEWRDEKQRRKEEKRMEREERKEERHHGKKHRRDDE